jgi:hypothetical protein
MRVVASLVHDVERHSSMTAPWRISRVIGAVGERSICVQLIVSRVVDSRTADVAGTERPDECDNPKKSLDGTTRMRFLQHFANTTEYILRSTPGFLGVWFVLGVRVARHGIWVVCEIPRFIPFDHT